MVASGPPWPQEFTEIIYVNGIFTPDTDPDPTHGSAVKSMERLRLLVFSMPRFQDLGDPTSNSVVEVNHYWNRNLAGDLAAFDEEHRCIATHERSLEHRSFLTAAVEWARCTGAHFTLPVVDNDIAQSATEFIQLRLHMTAPTIGDVGRLADFIQLYHGPRYRSHVITVTHSQGNMVLAQAIQQLPAKEGRPLQSGLCTAELSLAAPIDQGTFLSSGLDPQYLRGIDFNGDILGVLGLPNDFPHIDNDTSRAAAAALSTFWGSLPIIHQYRKVRWGLAIHGVDYNYFTSPEGTDSVQAKLAQLHDECTVGSIQVTPSSLTVPLGGSAKLGITVLSRAGHGLVGREFGGGGINSSIGSDSSVVALGPTSGAELADITFGGESFGQVSVTVPHVPFPGRVVELRSSIWVSTAGFSEGGDPNDPPGVPPPPASAPDWDGTPGGCSATVRTTAYKAWTDWGQACGRRYVLEIPPNPMPVRTQVRVQFADYPSGAFHGNSTFQLLQPDIEVSDTLNYACGKEYCLRATVLQAKNVYVTIMASDTTCFSDQCGSYSNRVPTSRPIAEPTFSRRRPARTAAMPGASKANPKALHSEAPHD